MKKPLRRLYRIRKQLRRLQLEIGSDVLAKEPYLWGALCRLADGLRVAIVRLGGVNYVD